MNWPDELTNELRRLIGEGLSAAKIGWTMNISRSAVIGKAHRLKLSVGGGKKPGRPKEQRRAIRAAAKAARRVAGLLENTVIRNIQRARAALPELPANHSDCAISLLDIGPRQCRYTVQDLPRHLFCGAQVVLGHPWCLRHARVVYAAQRPAYAEAAE